MFMMTIPKSSSLEISAMATITGSAFGHLRVIM
ncbi:hypothetical protein RO3G_06574 [Rhizopus delemar RA 99-880]|uniref:Uncharacterized protein n=1 Tax=Rhizopus delemar (strain RA 99-880 / ATCC MYA-4621 / FGSC 9543 / NRRL 43880) TaxID=246409 RepID=I1C089_RHIO9|nr:hypothetical protein RO3G_06574 [Rhizopus delemar RA 99-880]|eukprot:EIE81869.1 hypothetical protein RO3G_06574 [Rhizopus delemar RA 99-880]